MLLVVAVAVLLLFIVPPDLGFRLLARHPEARATVMPGRPEVRRRARSRRRIEGEWARFEGETR